MQISARVDPAAALDGHAPEFTCVLEIQTPPPTALPPALALALALDLSNSMEGAPLRALRTCVATLADRLADDDRLALVVFDRTAEIRTPLLPLREGRGLLLRAAIGIEAGGTTDLVAGWQEAVALLAEAPRRSLRRVILCTDGGTTAEPNDLDAFLDDVRTTRVRHDIGTSTLAVGRTPRTDLLAALALAGRGSAGRATFASEARLALTHEVDVLRRTGARAAEVVILPAAGSWVSETPRGAARSTDGSARLLLGELEGGERRRIVWSMRSDRARAATFPQLATARIRWGRPGDPNDRRTAVASCVVGAGAAHSPAVRWEPDASD